jgi:hypothetical protein
MFAIFHQVMAEYFYQLCLVRVGIKAKGCFKNTHLIGVLNCQITFILNWKKMDSRLEIQTASKNESQALPRYSIFKDSVLAKYSGNTAALLSVMDMLINTLSSRFQNVNSFFAEQLPFWVKGIYYILPLGVPMIPLFRHRCKNQLEIHDPDALELLNVLQQHDDDFSEFIKENPNEKKPLLDILTSYLRHEKSQSFNVVINLTLLSLRTVQGILTIAKGLELGATETDDKLSDWTSLISSISNMTYLSVLMLHNNFQKYHYSRHQHISRHLLQIKFFNGRSKSRLLDDKPELLEPLLPEDIKSENGEVKDNIATRHVAVTR